MATRYGVKLAYMNTLKERINAALDAAKMDQSELARAIGVTSVAVNGWCTGATKSIKGENLLKAAQALGVRPEWLASNRGPMKTEDLGPAISTPFRPVKVITNDVEIDDEIIAIPRYTIKASAGMGKPVFEVDLKGQPNFCRSGWVKKNGYKPEDLYSIETSGDSMEPTVPNGSSLIVHRQEEISNGRIHAIMLDGECYVKRLYKQLDGSIMIKSDNSENYEDARYIPGQDTRPFHILGLVVSVSFNV